MSRGTSETLSETNTSGEAESWGEAVTEGHATSQTTSLATTNSVGAGEAFEPIYADLPSSFHSLENLAYMSAQRIMALATGQFLLRVDALATLVKAAKTDRFAYGHDKLAALTAEVMSKSRYALPAAEVDRLILQRQQAIIAAAKGLPTRLVPAPDAEQPEDPEIYCV